MIYVLDVYTDNPHLDVPRGPQDLIRREAFTEPGAAYVAAYDAAEDAGHWVGESECEDAAFAVECFAAWGEGFRWRRESRRILAERARAPKPTPLTPEQIEAGRQEHFACFGTD